MRAIAIGLVGVLIVGASATVGQQPSDPLKGARARKVVKTEREWAKVLTHEQFLVTRMKETEPPFSGKYAASHAKGYYACVCCGSLLFNSKAKFESGTGWPSFWTPLEAGKIDSEVDNSTGEPRMEVMCGDCGGHLGHVFNDGPPPTGLRYCINSLSLKFLTEAQVKARLAKEKEQEEKAKAKDKEKGDGKAKAESKAGAPAKAADAETPG